ncbi:MAG: DUF3352 domain-containing protein [Aggregatilineales bacterium]
MSAARLFSLILLLLLMIRNGPLTRAQGESLVGWLPADFEGYVRIETANRRQAIEELNFAAFIGAFLQPARASFDASLTYNDFFPLDSFDVEGASFTTHVLPWLGDELLVGYQTLDNRLRVDTESWVLIIASQDAFQAASTLGPVLRGQDFLETDTHRGVTVYRGDRLAFAFLPSAVVIGPEALVYAVIEVQAGEGPTLSDDPIYREVAAALPQHSPITGFLRGEAAAASLSLLLSAGDSAAPLLAAVGNAVEALNGAVTTETVLLRGAVEAVGLAVQPNAVLLNDVRASVVVKLAETPASSTAVLDMRVLDFIPRSAMLVHVGPQARDALQIALVGGPLVNFSSRLLGAFPVRETAAVASGLIAPPTERDLLRGVEGLSAVLFSQLGIVLHDELLVPLDGSYAFALLPRPNDPLPLLNTSYDLLFVTQTDAGASWIERVERVIGAFVDDVVFLADRRDDLELVTIAASNSDEAIARLATGDGMLIVGTGDAALTAWAAGRGDNQLLNTERWQRLSGDRPPALYVDVNGLYNIAFPSAGGPVNRPVNQVALYGRSLSSELYALEARVVVSGLASPR